MAVKEESVERGRVRGKGVCFSIFFGLRERSRKNFSGIQWVSFLCAVTTCGVITLYQAPG